MSECKTWLQEKGGGGDNNWKWDTLSSKSEAVSYKGHYGVMDCVCYVFFIIKSLISAIWLLHILCYIIMFCSSG